MWMYRRFCRVLLWSLEATGADVYAFCIHRRPDFLRHFCDSRILYWAACQLELFQNSADRRCGRGTLNDFGSTRAHRFGDKEKTRARKNKTREIDCIHRTMNASYVGCSTGDIDHLWSRGTLGRRVGPTCRLADLPFWGILVNADPL